jgi:hypothetical protein
MAKSLQRSRSMAEVLAQYADVLTDDDRITYRAHACGAEVAGGKWQGWIEFLPLDGAAPIRSGRETTQPNRTDTVYWATGLTAVYLQGALSRALNPLVRPVAQPDAPAFAGPAPSLAQTASPVAVRDAVLNPFAVYERGEAPLRRQLAALSSWHLVNIIEAYELSDRPEAVLSRMPAPALIEIIVAAVAAG